MVGANVGTSVPNRLERWRLLGAESLPTKAWPEKASRKARPEKAGD